MIPIAQQIAEQRQCLSDIGNLVAKGGKGQSLAQHRQEVQKAILATLEWCRDHSEELRRFRQANEQPPSPEKGEER